MTTEIESTNTESNEPTWFIDEGIPGVGPRPTWLPEKYKTAAEVAKAYSELEKKLGVAPDEYEFKSKYLDPDYAPFQDLQKLAKEKRVPKEVVDMMIDSVDKYMSEFDIDPNEEIKKLGDNGEERVNTLDNWAKANFSKEAYATLSGSMRTAESIKVLEELRGKIMSNTAQIPTGNNGAVETGNSLDEIKMELSNNLQKYKTDPVYQKDISRRLEIAAKNAPGYIDKIGA